MNANIHYYYSTQPKHRKKPIRIEVEVGGGSMGYTIDVHGRFATQREASYVGRDIGARYDTFSEEWGRIVVEDKPPVIETID